MWAPAQQGSTNRPAISAEPNPGTFRRILAGSVPACLSPVQAGALEHCHYRPSRMAATSPPLITSTPWRPITVEMI